MGYGVDIDEVVDDGRRAGGKKGKRGHRRQRTPTTNMGIGEGGGGVGGGGADVQKIEEETGGREESAAGGVRGNIYRLVLTKVGKTEGETQTRLLEKKRRYDVMCTIEYFQVARYATAMYCTQILGILFYRKILGTGLKQAYLAHFGLRHEQVRCTNARMVNTPENK